MVLSIGTVSAGNAAQRAYHERQLARSRDDYYREAEGPAGTWVGSAAEQMGLAGEVSVEEFGRLLDGKDPATGVTLGGRLDRRKTLAFDLAFSAPKSVSLMRMAAEPETVAAIDRAHERAVMAALAYVEREGWKGRERRAGGERVAVEGSGVVGVLYRHETTRNADPQLHSHAVLANVVRGPSGRATAINSPVLYRQAKTAGTVYQAVLRGELGREFGITFDRPVNGLADIEGFDRGLVDRFSTRRAEILAGLRQAGLSPGSKSAAERVALASRRSKDMDLDHEQWRSEVRDALAVEGFGPEQAAGLTRDPAARERAGVGERLAAAPVGTIADRRATEDARAVRQAAMGLAEGYTADEVTDALNRVLDDERLVRVQDGETPRWTTARHLELEEQVRSGTVARTGETTAPRITTGTYRVPSTTPDGHALSVEQRRVLGALLTSGRGVEVIRARAGAGKTTIAGLARREFERHGMRVVGVAPTLQALAELDDVGLEVRDTLARTALGTGDHSRIMRTMDHRTVVIIDEAAMAQTREVAPLLRRAQERGAKVIAIGDDVQLQSVGAGGWFRYLAEHRQVPVLELTEVHRQRDPVERDRLNQLHRGDVAGWVRWADRNDRIHVEPTTPNAYAVATDRYRAALDEVDGDVDRLVVMAPQNTHRRALNEQLRRVVTDRGILDRSAERDFGGLLVAPGERLVATSTIRDGRTRVVENGERFEVLAVDAAGVRARAVAGARRGTEVQLPAAVLRRTDDGRSVEHGYARTVHKAQGMTVDQSILFVPDAGRLGRNLAYVGLTRTRDRADLVTVDADRAEGLERLVRGMGERRDHEAAMAYTGREQLDPKWTDRMSARELDEHRHALITETRQALTAIARADREPTADPDDSAPKSASDARRAAAETYAGRLLDELGRVHGRQVDRATEPIDPLTVPEHERPGLAVRQVRERTDRIGELTVATAEQLGAGHPVVARWLERHDHDSPSPTPAPARGTEREPLTPQQQAFADALTRWRNLLPEYAALGGRSRLSEFEELDRLRDASRSEIKTARTARESHQALEPRRRRGTAHQDWARHDEILERNLEIAHRYAESIDRLRATNEQELGRPLDDARRDLATRTTTVQHARETVRRAEQDLLAAGTAAVGAGAARVLGRNEGLDAAQAHRYDELAGRLAVRDVLTRHPAEAPAERWTSMHLHGLEHDVAAWRRGRELPLTERQRSTIDRAHERDRGRDFGPDLGR